MNAEKRRTLRIDRMLTLARHNEMVALRQLALANGHMSQADQSARRIDTLLGGMEKPAASSTPLELGAGAELMGRLYIAEQLAKDRLSTARQQADEAVILHRQANARTDRLSQNRRLQLQGVQQQIERREADDKAPKGGKTT